MVERQLLYATSGLRPGEGAQLPRAAEGEAEVNTAERDIDELCTAIIARRQPGANDLRLVTTVRRTITGLVRVGDGAEKIAGTAQNLHEINSPRPQAR